MKLQLHDLRVGNYYRTKIGVFRWSTEDWIALIEDSISLDDISGVELTEEMLVELGFEKNEVTLELYYSDFEHEERLFRFYWPENNRGGSLHFKPDSTDWWPDLVDNIKYVHVLQDLYYALKKEQLTLKEKG